MFNENQLLDLHIKHNLSINSKNGKENKRLLQFSIIRSRA